MLELDLKNALIKKNGFVFCLSYFSSGDSSIKMKLKSKVENITIGIRFYNCRNSSDCNVSVKIDGTTFHLTNVVSNRWLFTCISFDLLNQEIAIGLDNNFFFGHKLEDLDIRAPHDVQYVNIWWENEYLGIKFPEKFTLLNIHSNDRNVDQFKCGESGDLYAWNVEGWTSIGQKENPNLLTSKESTYKACQSQFQVNALPRLNMDDSVKLCNKTNGQLYFEDTVFHELRDLEGYSKDIKYWIPYTDEQEEGVFRNLYSKEIFENVSAYFRAGQPNGNHADNCVSSTYDGFGDDNCASDNFYSLCKVSKTKPYLTLRGLCPESQVERYYTSGNNAGKIIWKGNRFASIQYTDQWLLHSVLNNVWAKSDASYNSFLIGTNEWLIHNDINCFNKEYNANLSLR